MSDFSKMPANWAGEQALTEAEAFEWAIKPKKENIKTCEYQRGFDDGYKIGLEEAQQVTLDKFTGIIEENTELRRQIRTLESMNTRLREAILRGADEEWE